MADWLDDIIEHQTSGGDEGTLGVRRVMRQVWGL